MALIAIICILLFAAADCIVEIPKMLREKARRDILAFSLLLSLGVVLAILKVLQFKIGNPSDFFAWIYSPLQGIMEILLSKG